VFLLVGLGNPGPRYALNRHNVGFLAVDAVHRRHGFGPWRQKFSAEIAEGALGGERTILVKPLTYMNESGRSVGDIARFHKLAPSDVMVVHDELDLPPGKVRLKVGGGHGGHNGLRSLTAHLGDAYRRLRVGIGHPGDKAMVHTYVLHDFAKADAVWLDPLLDAIAADAPLLAEGKDQSFANRLHLVLSPPKADAGAPRPAKPPKPKADAAPVNGAVVPAARAPSGADEPADDAAAVSAAEPAAKSAATELPPPAASQTAPTKKTDPLAKGPFAALAKFVRGD
jgi:PTH1 family peptidyl-tRNA hydrolase